MVGIRLITAMPTVRHPLRSHRHTAKRHGLRMIFAVAFSPNRSRESVPRHSFRAHPQSSVVPGTTSVSPSSLEPPPAREAWPRLRWPTARS